MGSREGHFEDKGLWTSEDGVSSECYNQRPCLRLQFVVGGGVFGGRLHLLRKVL